MSTSSARRVKERGGGGKVAVPPPGKISPVPGRSVSAGKENSRPTSRVRAATQKPTVQPMVRIDKSAAAEDPRSRRSTSSVPRGRSSSPSEFSRALSDMRKNNSRVSLGTSRRKENNVGLKGLNEISDLEKRGSKNLVTNGVGDLQGDFQESKKVKIRVENVGSGNVRVEASSSGSLEKRVLKDNKKTQEIFDVDVKVLNESSEERERILNKTVMKRSNLEACLETDVKSTKTSDEVKMKSSIVGVPSSSSSGESKVAKKVSNDAVSLRENGANKYPSKLHQKLAFLEGKVKRIASDIKRTKEMLDNNNPDASKMILSDIQAKISGIEKAMIHVASTDGDSKMKSSISEESLEEPEYEKEVATTKSLAKGLNVEELEARLFPHNKLIRDRTSLKTSNDNAVATKSVAPETSHVGLEESEIQEMDEYMASKEKSSSLNAFIGKKASIDDMLMSDEKLDDFYDEQENMPPVTFEEDIQEDYEDKLNDIGNKTATGGWFVSEGESVLLAHGDGSCSFYDVTNCEEKAEYKAPVGVIPNIWQDCWIIRAPSADGCSGRYVVAASAGNSVHSGYCSWDFYTKQVQAYRFENETPSGRTALAPLSNNTVHERNTLSSVMATENRQWWYKPCGPLIVSTASCQKFVQIFDIRDGEHVMKWELAKPVVGMDYASPLQWRNRGKVAIAQSDGVSLWDVSSVTSHELQSVSASGRKITALHVNNSDAELGGGVRQRVSSSEAEGNDGVFCTSDSINVLDFRQPSGIALKIPKVGVDIQSTFSRGDCIYIGCSTLKSAGKQQYTSQIQQFSLRKQQLFCTYTLPESNAHSHFTALTQVWGNSSFAMGVSGLGLSVFDTLDYDRSQTVKEVIGPDDMYNPSFDYSTSRILLISKDRPARWRYLF